MFEFFLTLGLFAIAIFVSREIAKALISKEIEGTALEETLARKDFATNENLQKVAKTIPDVSKFATKEDVEVAISKSPFATTEEIAALKSDIETLRTMIDAMSATFVEFRKILEDMKVAEPEAPKPEEAPSGEPPKVEEPTAPKPEAEKPKAEEPPKEEPKPGKKGE